MVSASSTGVSNVREAKNVSLQVRNDECVREMHSFNKGPSPPFIYLGRHGRHSCDKIYQAFPPSVFAYCKQAIENLTVGRPGNETSFECSNAIEIHGGIFF